MFKPKLLYLLVFFCLMNPQQSMGQTVHVDAYFTELISDDLHWTAYDSVVRWSFIEGSDTLIMKQQYDQFRLVASASDPMIMTKIYNQPSFTLIEGPFEWAYAGLLFQANYISNPKSWPVELPGVVDSLLCDGETFFKGKLAGVLQPNHLDGEMLITSKGQVVARYHYDNAKNQGECFDASFSDESSGLVIKAQTEWFDKNRRHGVCKYEDTSGTYVLKYYNRGWLQYTQTFYPNGAIRSSTFRDDSRVTWDPPYYVSTDILNVNGIFRYTQFHENGEIKVSGYLSQMDGGDSVMTWKWYDNKGRLIKSKEFTHFIEGVLESYETPAIDQPPPTLKPPVLDIKRFQIDLKEQIKWRRKDIDSKLEVNLYFDSFGKITAIQTLYMDDNFLANLDEIRAIISSISVQSEPYNKTYSGMFKLTLEIKPN